MPKTQNVWIIHLNKVWSDGKKKNKDYKYKDAMKDAKKSYKKGSASVNKPAGSRLDFDDTKQEKNKTKNKRKSKK